MCVPVQIYVNEKGKYREVSPVIFTYVQIPTLALSKSGIRVEVDYFLSACEYKLPCILIVVLLDKNYIVSVVITFFYTILNYLLTNNDAFLTQPFGLNAGTLLPGPLAFRWTFQFYDYGSISEELAELLERISPYFLNDIQVFGVAFAEAAVFLALIAMVYRRREI